MALALYRKYRPRTFAEVIGQEHVTEPLSQALRSGRLHHAYLFSGPRGCGKTSSARILARSLNCEQGPTPEPCGVCASCKSLANDGAGSIDVIEIDAASHGGVDDARDLREKAFFAPASSRYKIYVIDEAHMVSSAGFNALLKLVEEPPDYVKFIFATTEPEKVLGTIRSRTHHYPFRLIPPAVLRPYLQQLTEAEGIHVDPAVFPLVVKAGAGSARDTLSVLDQLISGAGPEGVSYPRAVTLLGVTDVALIDDMCDALAAGDGAAAYQTIDRVAEAGHDPRRFASDLLERFRDLIILQQIPDAVTKGLIDGPADQLEQMGAQATRLGPATLSRCADIVHNGLVEMRGTTAPRLLLELITARMLLPGADDSSNALLQRLERMERRLTLSPGEELPPAESGPQAAPISAAPAGGGGISAASAGGGGISAARAAAAAAAAGRRAPAGGSAAQSGLTAQSGSGDAAAAPSAPAEAVTGSGSGSGQPEAAGVASPGSVTAETTAARPVSGGGAGGLASAAGPVSAVPDPSAGSAGSVSALPGAGEASVQSAAPVSAMPGSASPVSSAPFAPASAPPAAPESYPGAAGAVSAPPENGVRRAEPAGVMPDAPFEPGLETAVPGQLTAASIREVWPEIMVAVGRKSKKIAALAQGATVRDLEGQTVVLTFRFPAHAKMVAAEPALLSDALYEALGGRWQIRCDVAGDSGPSPGSTSRAGTASRAPQPSPASGPAASASGIPQPSAPASAPGGTASASAPGGTAPASAPGGTAPASAAGGTAPASAPGGTAQASAPGGTAPASAPGGAASASAAGGTAQASAPGGTAPASAPGTRPASGVPSAPVSGYPDEGLTGSPEAGASGSALGAPYGGAADPASSAAHGMPASPASGSSGPSAGAGGSFGAGAGSGRGGASSPAQRAPQGGALSPAQRDSQDRQGARSSGGRQSATAPSASAAGDDGDGWPEPARPGGLATAVVTPPVVEEEEAWPETARPGGVAPRDSDPSVGQSSPVTTPDLTGPAGGRGFGGPATPAPASAQQAPTAPAPTTPAPTAPARTAPAPTPPAAPPAAPATAPPAAGGRRTSSGLAAARAAAAGAGRGTNAAAPAKTGAWSDGSPTEEAPYDPEYDGPVRPGNGSAPAAKGGQKFDGFDPGDEPLDDVIDEKTARQSSEQQAVQLLRDALGAEKISES
ncbi:DNA polymerase III subunits gamma and tau [Actinoplanes friuliensis DSM 7358]|uniref:DNA polymerase III subunit gamma/tau n=1 Tax=Actinoplanes friuliensis DSM 7358 TaxID=1246995 RepID=U5WFC9_9ACTN|nr:DNA polymerase III subunit gamma and tau [Actinoplanes friuliensis]AGZ46616.1 DNA polymerase III subunits gamma and tau [Actinoplanes friuliensis DSM 7358]